MPSTVTGQLDNRAKSPTYEKYEGMMRAIIDEYTAKVSGYFRLQRERQDAGGDELDVNLDDTNAQIQHAEQYLMNLLHNRDNVAYQYLAHSIEEYKKKPGENLLRGSPFYPVGMWEAAQTELDHHCLENNIPLAPTRYKPEYRKYGLYANTIFDQLQKEEDAKDPADRIKEVTVWHDERHGHESHVEWVDGNQNVRGAQCMSRCGPRLCGTLGQDGKTCGHEHTMRCFNKEPKEWVRGQGWWRNGCPFEIGHVAPEGVDTWAPYFDFVGDEWKQLREYDPDEGLVGG
jgi:hypothetical protein